MATKLTKRVERETLIRYKTREVVVSLVPASESPNGQESLEFRLKGTRQTIRRTLQDVFNASKMVVGI